MINKRQEKMRVGGAFVAAVLGLGMATVACTPATADPPVTSVGGAAGAAGGSPGTAGSVGTGGSVETGVGGNPGVAGSAAGDSSGSAGSSGLAGTTGSAGTGGSAGVTGVAGTGGSGAGTAGDSGGAKAGTGGSVGGAVGSGGTGGAATTGCNWVHNTTADTWSFNPAPADKVVLFDGTTLADWHKLNMPGVPVTWKLVAGGAMQVVPSGTGSATQIQSNMKFDDVCVHVEYLTPVFPSTTTDVQKQGNSGVYLKSAYEMQILDTHSSPPLVDGCGAVYKVQAPLVVACYQYLIWNTYEIEFKSSVWDTSNPPKKLKDAVFVQVALNGKLVQKNVDLNPAGGFTQAGIPDVAGPQPLGLQDHLDLVEFRNIWVTIPHN